MRRRSFIKAVGSLTLLASPELHAQRPTLSSAVRSFLAVPLRLSLVQVALGGEFIKVGSGDYALRGAVFADENDCGWRSGRLPLMRALQYRNRSQTNGDTVRRCC